MQLLLLDNDANFRRALAISLRLDGILVHEAHDLGEAESLVGSHAYDAVVLHLTQLGVHAEFLAAVWAKNPCCRVVVCNAHQEVLNAARADFRRPVLELRRPFRAVELLRCLGSDPSPAPG